MRTFGLSNFLSLPILSLAIVMAAAAQARQPLPPVSLEVASLPSAPVPVGTSNSSDSIGIIQVRPAKPEQPRLHVFDWTLLGAAATLRILDYTSTEQGLDRPQHLHEAILPAALVANKPAFAAFEAGTVAVNYFAYRLLVRHRLRSLARVSQYMYIGIMSGQVAHNYQLIGQVPAN